MKSLTRFISLSLCAACLVVLTNCTQTTSNQTPPPPTVSSSHSGHPAKININTAILSELDKLEAKLGIPALSNKIQAARPYGNPEELVAKKVLTQEQYDQIKDQVTIEDVVLTGEAKDIDYLTKLALMKGHMIVAQELLEKDLPAQAEPHIGHPVEEIYIDIEEQLPERNVPEFKQDLISLQNLVKSQPKNAKVNEQFETSLKAIDNAIASLPETQRQSPAFVLQVIDGLLDTAATEYTAAIANDKITAAIEYQDARGFITYANQLYQQISPQVAQSQPEINKAITENLSELQKAFPSAIPPHTPVKQPAEVAQLVKTIEQNSQKLSS